MNTLDSRSLHYTDCFIQKFNEADSISYSIASRAAKVMPGERERPFTLRVKEGKTRQSGQQHNVMVRYESGTYKAEPAELEIVSGDFVLWNTSDASAPGFLVMGEGERTRFDSSALGAGSVFTHAFGLPGEYSWVDPNYGFARGTVHVLASEPTGKEDKALQQKKMIDLLQKPAVIQIKKEQSKPIDVQVMVGQTVFWAIEQAPGMAITDIRFATEPMNENPYPEPPTKTPAPKNQRSNKKR